MRLISRCTTAAVRKRLGKLVTRNFPDADEASACGGIQYPIRQQLTRATSPFQRPIINNRASRGIVSNSRALDRVGGSAVSEFVAALPGLLALENTAEDFFERGEKVLVAESSCFLMQSAG
jgi:hypothetical protein